ncbi:aspartate ammonia-lyase [Trichococcus palustris]|nr:aspartate ammonia-lyase [Trichococcus palustris]
MRIEADSIGTLAVPKEAYYGVQSLRAKENFSITDTQLHPEMIRNLAKIKKVAAVINAQSGILTAVKRDAIVQACDEIVAGSLYDSFIVDAIQGGAGTSANMNANEVIANRAIEILGGSKGDYRIVHPNDDVNLCQSTNDVFPTAGKMTVLTILPNLIAELKRLEEALGKKGEEFSEVIKMGRTQLQDAVPTTLGRSFHAYQSFVKRDIRYLESAAEEMKVINLGGTAIGNAINATPAYLEGITDRLSEELNISFTQAEDLFDATQNVDGFVRVSAAIKTAAVNLSKMSNDLRLLSSGPRAGIGEISLPAKQNGSSIMPGKVNPVIPEVVSQVAFRVIGNDVTITMAAESGQLELNAFEPIIFHALFESIDSLAHAVQTLTVNCIAGIQANEMLCYRQVEESAGLATALCPYIGYQKASVIAKESLKTGKSVRELVLEKRLFTVEETDSILDLKRIAGIPAQAEIVARKAVS